MNKLLDLICPSRLPVVQSGGQSGFTRAPTVRPGPYQLSELLEGGAAALPEQLSGQRDLHQRSGLDPLLQNDGKLKEGEGCAVLDPDFRIRYCHPLRVIVIFTNTEGT